MSTRAKIQGRATLEARDRSISWCVLSRCAHIAASAPCRKAVMPRITRCALGRIYRRIRSWRAFVHSSVGSGCPLTFTVIVAIVASFLAWRFATAVDKEGKNCDNYQAKDLHVVRYNSYEIKLSGACRLPFVSPPVIVHHHSLLASSRFGRDGRCRGRFESS